MGLTQNSRSVLNLRKLREDELNWGLSPKRWKGGSFMKPLRGKVERFTYQTLPGLTVCNYVYIHTLSLSWKFQHEVGHDTCS